MKKKMKCIHRSAQNANLAHSLSEEKKKPSISDWTNGPQSQPILPSVASKRKRVAMPRHRQSPVPSQVVARVRMVLTPSRACAGFNGCLHGLI